MVLMYLLVARNAGESPHIVVSGHIGVKRCAPFVCVNNKLVPFAVLCAQVARRMVALVPHNDVFNRKAGFDLLFEKVDLVRVAKHIKRGIVFHYVK